MSGLDELIAASHKGNKMPAGRKAKIVKAVREQAPKEQKKNVQTVTDHVLNKDDAHKKTDDALVAEIKAALKGSFMVTSAIDKLITAGGVATAEYTLRVNDRDSALWRLLEYIKECGDVGHSISFKIDDKPFGFDGDGADKIVTMDRDEIP